MQAEQKPVAADSDKVARKKADYSVPAACLQVEHYAVVCRKENCCCKKAEHNSDGAAAQQAVEYCRRETENCYLQEASAVTYPAQDILGYYHIVHYYVERCLQVLQYPQYVLKHLNALQVKNHSNDRTSHRQV